LWSRVLSPLTGPFAAWAFDINVALNRQRGLRVLEVGAGYGDILIYLRERGCETCGTDLSEAAVAKGREYGVDMRLGFLRDVALPRGSFDAAIMCHSLEHVPDPSVEIAELAALLKPGGRLHIAVPNGQAVRLDQDGLEWAHLSHPLHFWYFDPRNLARLLNEHGFTPVIGPKTTTRHHAFNAWRYQFVHRGPLKATRHFLAYLRESVRHPDGGDVLRVVAEKRR
jgi:SAM-dependent methyltransferase